MRKAILRWGGGRACFAFPTFPGVRPAAATATSQTSGGEGRVRAVLEQWNDIGRKLIAMAEDFPEDKYEFKPVPEERTFAAQLMHAAGSMYYFTDRRRWKEAALSGRSEA